MTQPYLSLCLIVGDAHLALLPRMLESFLVRPSGKPAVDEIVIGFNGKNREAFSTTMTACTKLPHAGVVDLIVIEQEWTGNFASARQETFEAATGIWRMYADVDDILLSSKDLATRESVEGEGATAKTATLQDWLRSLPAHVNCIRAPYNYVVSDTGKPLVRTRRPRIIRWDPYWAWTGKVHEVLRHTLDRESAIWNAGLVLEHHPIIAEQVRSERNFEITQQSAQDLGDAPLSQELEYGLAVELMNRGEFAAACDRFQKAASMVFDHEPQLLYLGYAVRCALEIGRLDVAKELAKAAVAAAPHRAEGYLLASDVAFALKMPVYAIQWYEASLGKDLPSGVMTEDKVATVLQPVRSAGVAYLQTWSFEKALAVAEKALAVASDPFAAKVKAEAESKIAWRKIAAVSEDLLGQLIDMGFVGVAQRVLDHLAPVVDDHDLREKVRKAFEKPVEVLPEDSQVLGWFRQDAEAVHLVAPVDGRESFVDLVTLVAQAAVEQRAKSFYLSATDTEDLTPWSKKARLDAVTAKMLALECEKHGEVTDLRLIEEQSGTRRLAIKVKRTSSRAWTPDVTFWCPAFAEPWGPWRILRDGMGGSEESVVYLAKELAARGLKVQVFAPLDPGLHRGLHIEDSVRYQPLNGLDVIAKMPGLVVAHRAPEAVRMPCFTPNQLAVWHQDAFYQAGWTPAIAGAVKNLWVSEWQKKELLKQIAIEDAPGLVLGDGIPASCYDRPEGEVRDPLACVYASSPLRGMEQLLDMWPEIIKRVPGATLHFYYGWETAPTFLPNIAALRERVMAKIAKLPGITWHGRVAQSQLEQEMRTKGVLLYPCTFIEGFMIAGIRATAAGCIPVYRKVAALPEVQYPSPFATDDTPLNKGGREAFIESAVAALQVSPHADRTEMVEWTRKHLWSVVADRFIQNLLLR